MVKKYETILIIPDILEEDEKILENLRIKVAKGDNPDPIIKNFISDYGNIELETLITEIIGITNKKHITPDQMKENIELNVEKKYVIVYTERHIKNKNATIEFKFEIESLINSLGSLITDPSGLKEILFRAANLSYIRNNIEQQYYKFEILAKQEKDIICAVFKINYNLVGKFLRNGKLISLDNEKTKLEYYSAVLGVNFWRIKKDHVDNNPYYN